MRKKSGAPRRDAGQSSWMDAMPSSCCRSPLRRRGLVADLHSVRETGTAAAGDEDANALVRAAVLLHDGLDLGSRFFAQGDHAWKYLLNTSLDRAFPCVNLDVAPG